MMNGNIWITCSGNVSLISPHDLANPISTEIITVPAMLPQIVHLPKIKIASEMNPIPLTVELNVPFIVSMTIAPANPE